MATTVGFVILNYGNPAQLMRMGRTLRGAFPSAPIVCNHDFGQCGLDPEPFDGIMCFVRPHQPMRWGHISCNRAVLRCLSHMYGRSEGPDWFLVLSGTTYPIKPPGVILERLERSEPGAFMECRDLESLPSGLPFASQARWRYLRLRRLWLARDQEGRWRRAVRLLPRFPGDRWWLPFGPRLRCHVGGFWFGGHRRVARLLLDSPRRYPRLYRHCELTPIPEESLFQTVVGNAPDLPRYDDDLTFVRWPPPERSRNPEWLTVRDLDALRESGDLFARKIEAGRDEGLLDVLDAIVDGSRV